MKIPRSGNVNLLEGGDLERYGSGWGREGKARWSCLYLPRCLEEKASQITIGSFAVGDSTFVFCGGPELGQPGSVSPIKFRTQTEGGAICPWLGSGRHCGTPKDEDITIGRVGVRKRIPDDDFGTIWINCTKSSKGDVGGGIDDRGEDKICGE